MMQSSARIVNLEGEISLERWAHNYSKFRIPDNSGRMVEEIILERA